MFLLLSSIIAAIVIAIPIIRQYPAEITAPDQIAGIPRLRDSATQETTDRIAQQVARQTGTRTAVAANYATAGDAAHQIIVTGASELVLDLAGNLELLPAAMNGNGFAFTEFRPVPAGPLGGMARCGFGSIASGVNQDAPVAMCHWADHGSIGGVLFFNRSVDEAARLFPTFRAAVLRRV